MPRSGALRRATAIVPLALLSAAWTLSLAGAGAGSTNAGGAPADALPDGSTVPARAIDAPASVSLPGAVSPAVPSGRAGRIVAAASTSGIPATALAAYQRAEAVINAADRSCRVPWELIAAIGRVESDHGRFDGNTLGSDGVARPGIYGIALDGRHDTATIGDTDAGQYDSDVRWDRAVGPMQFIPSTWSVVGVDGDNDGLRNPQDVDDAALATAVYLCSGDDDLSGTAGQRASVWRYNHSDSYVDLVLSVMRAYQDGDFAAIPTQPTSAGLFGSTRTARVPGGDHGTTRAPGAGKDRDRGPDRGTATAVATGGGTPDAAPTTPKPPKKPGPTPTPQPTQQPTPQPTPEPTQEPVKAPLPTPVPTLPSTSVPPVDQTLTFAQAQAQCLAQGVSALAVDALNACVRDLMTP